MMVFASLCGGRWLSCRGALRVASWQQNLVPSASALEEFIKDEAKLPTSDP